MEQEVDDLLAVLGRERQALGHLLFRLVEARGLLAIGEGRFLHLAAQDLEAAAESVREVELRRALLPPVGAGGTLRDMAATAAPPLSSILHDHRVALGRLAAEVGAALEATSDLAAEGLAQIRSMELAASPMPAPAGGSRAKAALRRSSEPADELDREILAAGYEAVLNASARMSLPSLVAFLG